MPTNRRVAIGQEVNLVGEAERLKRLGDQDFESVYGPKTFNVVEDARSMAGVGMMTQEQVNNLGKGSAAPKAVQQVAPATSPAPEPQIPQPVQEEQIPEPQIDPNTLTCPHCGKPLPEFEKKQDELSEDPEVRLQQVAERLQKLNPRAPSADQLRSWKQMHGDVYAISLSADKTYLFRYLKRQEWIQLNADPTLSKMTEDQIDERIFQRCVLWPAYDQMKQLVSQAGLMSMVVQQIRLQSLFLDPGYVANMTLKI